MAVDDEKPESDGQAWNFCRLPFWQTGNATSPYSSSSSSGSKYNVHSHNHNQLSMEQSSSQSSSIVSSVAKSLIPTRRRLRLDPHSKLYFPYEPGKQARSAMEIKNICKSHVAFKFQTTAPKSCFMRPPGGILAPNESLIATVFKFVELPENNGKPVEQKSKVKFKIISLKVQAQTDYVPELFDEQREQVAVEQILGVVFLDPTCSSPAMKKLTRQLAMGEAAFEGRRKHPEDASPKIVGEGLIIDQWKERRERYLAKQQQIEGVDAL